MPRRRDAAGPAAGTAAFRLRRHQAFEAVLGLVIGVVAGLALHDPIAIRDERAGGGPNALVGSEDPGKIQRIGGADGDDPAVGGLPADLAKLFHGVGQRELFAAHAMDESPAANLAPCFQPSINAGQLAPWRRARLTREQAPEHDAVPAQERARLNLDSVFIAL